MTTQEALQHLDSLTPNPYRGRWLCLDDGKGYKFNGTSWVPDPSADMVPEGPAPCGSYTTLKPADAVAHLNEVLSAEIDRFEHDTSLRLAAVKVLRDKKAGDIFVKVQAHVR